MMLLEEVRSAQKVFCLPEIFSKSKRAAMLKVQIDPLMHNICAPSSFAVHIEGHTLTGALFVLFKLCTTYKRNHTMPVAWINLRRLSTYCRPPTAQGHMHLFHFFQQGPNIQRHLIWACHFLLSARFLAKLDSIPMRGKLSLFIP